MLCVKYHVSCVTCHMSCVECHVSPVTWHLLTPPLRKIGWFAKTKNTTNYFMTDRAQRDKSVKIPTDPCSLMSLLSFAEQKCSTKLWNTELKFYLIFCTERCIFLTNHWQQIAWKFLKFCKSPKMCNYQSFYFNIFFVLNKKLQSC